MTQSPEQAWNLEKRVPVALIFALLFQTVGAIWWASGLTQQVEQNVSAISTLDTSMQSDRRATQLQAVQMGRVEEQISGLRNDVSRLITTIERQQQRMQP